MSWFWSKLSENFDFSQYLWKSLDLGQHFSKSRFKSISSIKSIRVKIFPKIYKNLEFVKKSFENSRFWSKLTKMLVLDRAAENVDYSNFGQYSQIFRFWSQFSKNFENLHRDVDFGKKKKKFQKCRFWLKLSKISILEKIVEKSQTRSNLWK